MIPPIYKHQVLLLISSVRPNFKFQISAKLSLPIPQYLHHTFRRLLVGEDFVGKLPLFVYVDQNMLWGWNQAMLNATVPAQAFLVGPGMEETDIEFFFSIDLG